MKRLVLIASLALGAFCCHAQQGEIIYRDFEPDSILIYWEKLGPVWIDLDVNGESNDLMMQMCISGPICYPEIFTANSNIWICFVEPDNTDIILTEVEEEDWITVVSWDAGPTASRYNHYGFRIQQEGNYYYGWFENYNRVVGKNEKQTTHYGFDRTAFCTIPDYPLLWGQTSLTENIEETESNAFTDIYPNPTTGMVTVTGENLRQAEVFNMLGQQMFSIKGEGDELQINMVALPAGIYFVNITDEEGRRCVRKVVKE